MNNYKYILEPYKGRNSRYTCPSCGKRNEFTRYIDTETGQHLHPDAGMCNGLINCAYHYPPKQYFADNPVLGRRPFDRPGPIPIAIGTLKGLLLPASFIDKEIFTKSLTNYTANNLVIYLNSLFGTAITKQLTAKYKIGTSKHWQGSTVFWQIDTDGNIHSGKIMLYNPQTGKRVKEPFNHITWAHSVLKLKDYHLQQCFFGQHLLKDNTKEVAITESEKTALIASVYYPEFIWLACGSLTNLSAKMCKILQGRKVTLFPDLNGYERWTLKAKELYAITNFQVSGMLEKDATDTEKEQGLDLADYLIRFKLSAFITPLEKMIAKNPAIQDLIKVLDLVPLNSDVSAGST